MTDKPSMGVSTSACGSPWWDTFLEPRRVQGVRKLDLAATGLLPETQGYLRENRSGSGPSVSIAQTRKT